MKMSLAYKTHVRTLLTECRYLEQKTLGTFSWINVSPTNYPTELQEIFLKGNDFKMMEMLISLVCSLCYAHTDQNTALYYICIELLLIKNRVNLRKCIAISFINILLLYKLSVNISWIWTLPVLTLNSIHHNSVSPPFQNTWTILTVM